MADGPTVATFTVTGTVVLAEIDEETGNTEHTAVAGAPEQVSDTVPLKVAADVRLRRYVAVAPAATGGEAVCTDQAKSVLLLLTVTVTDEDAAVPVLSVATAVMVWLPFPVWVVFHDIAYGAAVTCAPSTTPSSLN